MLTTFTQVYDFIDSPYHLIPNPTSLFHSSRLCHYRYRGFSAPERDWSGPPTNSTWLLLTVGLAASLCGETACLQVIFLLRADTGRGGC